jgi:hypothetical protein
VQICVSFALVCFAWIFFRANSIHDAVTIAAKLTILPAELAGYIRQLPQAGMVGTLRNAFQLGRDAANSIQGFGLTQFGLSWIFIISLLIADFWTKETPGITKIMRKPLVFRWAGYYALVLTILFSWNAGSSEFIYFTF